MIGTPEYKLAKFLDSVIKPSIPDKYMLSSTNHFIEKLKQVKAQSHQILVSFDVVSLFTNIPLEETTQIIANYLIDKDNSNAPSMEKHAFIKLMKLATQGMLLYNGELFKQIDGVPMGSPLKPTLANFFLANLENKLLNKTRPCFYPKIYLRYVDDIFAIFDDNLSITKFLNLLNKQHSNMQFTMEKSMQALPFLDVYVQIRENELDLSVWPKEANTGILMNFNAICPNVWKSSLVLCLLNRPKSICSSRHLFEVEIGKLKRLFYDNNYPTWFFDKIYNKFKAKLHDIPVDEISLVNNVELCPIFVPYVGEASIRFVKALSRLCLSQFDVRLLPLYHTNKVGQYFQLKSETPLPLCSNVV